jgi:hypothetical protein
MSQLDKLNYLPLLFWFLVFFILMYFILFSYILPLIFSGLKVRELFYRHLLNEVFIFFDAGFLFAFLFKSNSFISIIFFLFSFFSSSLYLEVFFFRFNFFLCGEYF